MGTVRQNWGVVRGGGVRAPDPPFLSYGNSHVRGLGKGLTPAAWAEWEGQKTLECVIPVESISEHYLHCSVYYPVSRAAWDGDQFRASPPGLMAFHHPAKIQHLARVCCCLPRIGQF